MKKELEAKRFTKEPSRGIKPAPHTLNRRTKEPNIINPKEGQPNKNPTFQAPQKVEAAIKSVRNLPPATKPSLYLKNLEKVSDKLVRSEREMS